MVLRVRSFLFTSIAVSHCVVDIYSGTSVQKDSIAGSNPSVREQFLDSITRANTDVTKAVCSESLYILACILIMYL